MTTQVVVGGGLIPYEPDIVDQYFALTTMAVLKARFQRQSKAKSLLPRCALRPLQRASIFPAGVFFRASVFNVRTCSDVHARRVPFVLDFSCAGIERKVKCRRGY
jgi:hypothetical protein